jgi:excinuclease ABC subunit A
MRDTIGVKGARENNLKNIDLEIPREKLVVLTGLSGSGKSSLAFETIYAEGQRRFLESLSAFSRKYVAQLKKPDVDLVYGLSPVISIEQKAVSQNPRSTVGTMTDIFDYFRVLFTASGTAHCPYCRQAIPTRSAVQIAEHVLALPSGTVIEIDAPIFKIYGEDYPYLFGEVRSQGYRRLRVDDELVDMSEEFELDEAESYNMEVVVDTFVVKPDIFKSLVVAIENGLRVGEGFLRFRILRLPPHPLTPSPTRGEGEKALPLSPAWERGLGGEGTLDAFYAPFACPEHHVTMGEVEPYYFSFNQPSSACPTCLGLGIYLHVHPDLLVPDKRRSVKGGAFIPEAFKYDKNSWSTRLLYSVARRYGFSLDTPFDELPPAVMEIIFYGTKGERFPLALPEGATKGDEHVGKLFRFDGIINEIERRYRHYRRQKVAHTWMEEYLKRVMVEQTCPDCQGAKLKRQRLLVMLGGKNVIELGDLSLAELKDFMAELPALPRNREAGEQIAREIVARLDLLLDIGLDYMSLNRKAATLSGGEAQRVRLSVQIGSELMGMLYVLDEPSIGLHPRDNIRMIRTLKRLRDVGNTVIVVEHDEETIRAADHIIEIGPGPGVHGGRVVAQGTLAEIAWHPDSLTGQYLSGRQTIAMPTTRRRPCPPIPQPARPLRSACPPRQGEGEPASTVDELLPLSPASGALSARGSGGEGESGSPSPVAGRGGGGVRAGWLTIRGARQNNLRRIDVAIPLGLFVCITGVSGSGKSTLVNEILFKKLYSVFHDSRVLPGAHDGVEGLEHVRGVINIDQSPIGRTPTSNPATYIGVYDAIRQLFARAPESERRGYTPSRFSFNMKGGRCEECAGQGIMTTSLQFLADVEVVCPACKGARYNEETLEVTYRGQNIAQVLDMSIEEAASFFKEAPLIAHKLGVLNQLGMGYLKLGQSSTTISGGEAQRVKLAHELGKIKRGARNLYILDEPTTGLHLADIQRLLDSLNRLVEAGNTVLVIEHHLDVIKTADWVIDLGPEGGKHGGTIVAQGTPEQVASCPDSYTGQFLREVLARTDTLAEAELLVA